MFETYLCNFLAEGGCPLDDGDLLAFWRRRCRRLERRGDFLADGKLGGIDLALDDDGVAGVSILEGDVPRVGFLSAEDGGEEASRCALLVLGRFA